MTTEGGGVTTGGGPFTTAAGGVAAAGGRPSTAEGVPTGVDPNILEVEAAVQPVLLRDPMDRVGSVSAGFAARVAATEAVLITGSPAGTGLVTLDGPDALPTAFSRAISTASTGCVECRAGLVGCACTEAAPPRVSVKAIAGRRSPGLQLRELVLRDPLSVHPAKAARLVTSATALKAATTTNR